MNLEEIGEKAFSFALLFSVLNTIIVLTLLASGYPPEQLQTPLFMAATYLYSNVNQMAQNLPTNATISDITAAAGTLLISGIGQFLTSLLFGFLTLIQTFALIIPPEVSFLVIPLYFIGAFLQVMVWYYFMTRVLDTFRSWLPFWS